MKLHRTFIWPILMLAYGLAGCNHPNQNHAITVGSALSSARETNQLVIVEFWDFNADCQKMDEKVFEHPLVLRDLEDFIRVRVNYPWQKHMANKMMVGGAPGFASLRPDGSVITSSTGKLDPDAMRRFLIRSRIFR